MRPRTASTLPSRTVSKRTSQRLSPRASSPMWRALMSLSGGSNRVCFGAPEPLPVMGATLTSARAPPHPPGGEEAGGAGGPGAARRAGAAPAGMPGGTATTDLSSMTPREQADRLFDRVMTASEGGNAGEVTFFGPMALQAYGMIGQLDADARFHVGLIEAALANDTGATAQADSLAKEFPRHLFVPLIRWEVANRRGDTGRR